MLSGTDIPIRSADFLFECTYKTRLKFSQFKSYISLPSHNQWMILTENEANIIVNQSITEHYTATDLFIHETVNMLCSKRSPQSCPDETLIGRILFNYLKNSIPSFNLEEFIKLFSGLIMYDIRGLSLSNRHTSYSPINWYTYKSIIAIDTDIRILYNPVTTGIPNIYYSRPDNTKQITDEDTPDTSYRYTHFFALIFLCNLLPRPVDELDRHMFFRKVSKYMPFDKFTVNLYSILYSKNRELILGKLVELNTITNTLPIANPSEWIHLNTSYNFKYNLLCKLPEYKKPITEDLAYDYDEDYKANEEYWNYINDYDNNYDLKQEAEKAPPYEFDSTYLHHMISNNFNLEVKNRSLSTGGGNIVFIFNKNKYIVSNNNGKYTITENNNYMSTSKVKKLIKNILHYVLNLT
jgi:hypothetical protein